MKVLFLRSKSSLVAVALSLLLVMFQGCSPTSFSGSSEQPPVTANGGGGGGDGVEGGIQACGAVLRQITTGVKLLFVIDTSGSNAGFDGTDPGRAMRSGSLQAFLGDFGDKTNFCWGFLAFAGKSAVPLIDENNLPTFADRAAMEGALSEFASIEDKGDTPYRAALQMAESAITNDKGLNTDKYIVVFMSDGMPYPEVDESLLAEDVRAIMASKPGQVTFNGVFYGTGDPLAANRLAAMVRIGNGAFLDTNANPTGKSFKIDDVIKLPGQNCRN